MPNDESGPTTASAVDADASTTVSSEDTAADGGSGGAAIDAAATTAAATPTSTTTGGSKKSTTKKDRRKKKNISGDSAATGNDGQGGGSGSNENESVKSVDVNDYLPPLPLVITVLACSGFIFLYAFRDVFATGRVIGGASDDALLVSFVFGFGFKPFAGSCPEPLMKDVG